MLLFGPDIVLGMRTPAQCQAAHEAAALTAGRATVVRQARLRVYVNEGRTVADCPNCGAGISLDPGWPEARCFGLGCYSVYPNATWPPNLDDIEAVLLARPLRHQHWQTTETVADLEAENIAQGLPRREPTIAERRAKAPGTQPARDGEVR